MLNYLRRAFKVKILISNDDGIYSDGIWTLAREVSKIAEVVIVAPDREQSAVGTAVSLRKPLRVQKIVSLEPGIEAYSVEGTPSDSVIVGLGKLIPGKIDLVISGINQGSNMGEDVLISGTVGAALAAYLRGFPSIAISIAFENWSLPFLQDASRFTALLAKRIGASSLSGNILLNVNMPGIPLAEVKDVKITSLAHRSHVNTVEEGNDGRRSYYMLIRESVNHQEDPRTDIRAKMQGKISITPLHLFLNDRLAPGLLERITDGLLEELKTQGPKCQF
jgi:5'-nucleotidase